VLNPKIWARKFTDRFFFGALVGHNVDTSKNLINLSGFWQFTRLKSLLKLIKSLMLE